MVSEQRLHPTVSQGKHREEIAVFHLVARTDFDSYAADSVVAEAESKLVDQDAGSCWMDSEGSSSFVLCWLVQRIDFSSLEMDLRLDSSIHRLVSLRFGAERSGQWLSEDKIWSDSSYLRYLIKLTIHVKHSDIWWNAELLLSSSLSLQSLPLTLLLSFFHTLLLSCDLILILYQVNKRNSKSLRKIFNSKVSSRKKMFKQI